MMISNEVDFAFNILSNNVERIITAADYCQIGFCGFIKMAIEDKLAEIEIAIGEEE
ncbi:MAG: hypothetical protein H8D45_06745 [Bacteroidetes bacterium]|nr:hypothetical protein [Bacteroidota bacterium]